MADGGHLDEPIWDGNGGTLDPRKATQRDMLVVLNVKMDKIVLPMLERHDEWLRKHDGGELSDAQKRTVLDVVQKDRDTVLERRSLKAPILAAVIATLALALMAIQTIQLIGGST